MDAARGDILEPCSGSFRKVERQVLDDEEVVVRPAYSTSEAEVFQPHSGVGVYNTLGVRLALLHLHFMSTSIIQAFMGTSIRSFISFTLSLSHVMLLYIHTYACDLG